MLRAALRTGAQSSAWRPALPAMRRAMSTTEEFDVVVVGGGPGGYVGAIKAGQLGLKVACVEKRGSLGGTCLNVGCIPSKALLHSSHLYEEASKHFKEHGIKVEGLEMDFPALMSRKTKVVDGLTKGIEGLFKKNKVTYLKGAGKITAKGEVTVTPIDGGEAQVVKAKNIMIATGSEVAKLPGVPVDQETIVDSTGALSLKEIPKSMVVIGGGVIGLEMGSVYSRLGSKVTVVEFLDAICGAGIDAEIAKSMQKTLKKKGMTFMLKTKVMGAEKQADGVELTLEPRDGGESSKMKADVVLVSTGRVPHTEGLGLEEMGIKTGPRGMIEIDDHFATNVPGIYAIGDCVRGAMLAHKAEEEGIACIEMLAGLGGHVNYDAIPGVLYTHPEVASVGKTEDELKEAGIKYKVGKFPFLANSRARANADTDGMVKFISDAETDRILGIHIMASNAGEMIAEGVLGMEYGASSEDIARTCHAHPTMSEAFKEAAMATYDKPIHF